jgi:SAM-dependent methyltransferase
VARELRNVLINRIQDRLIATYAERYLTGRLIDIGCGTKPYARIVSPFVDEHVGVDHVASLHDISAVDLTGTAYDVPADEGSFDAALCTSVLEHLEDPRSALEECRRLLKPGGTAVYTVPFIWHVHEAPRDFYRFTEHGLRYLADAAGLDVVEMEAMAGLWVTLGQLLAYRLSRLDRGIVRTLRLLVPVLLVVQGTAYALDRLDPSREWPLMYIAALRRPTGSP